MASMFCERKLVKVDKQLVKVDKQLLASFRLQCQEVCCQQEQEVLKTAEFSVVRSCQMRSWFITTTLSTA